MLSGVCVGLSWLKLPNVSDPTLSQRLPRIPDGLFALLRTRARVYVLWLRGTLHALLLCPKPRGEGCLVLSWLAGTRRETAELSSQSQCSSSGQTGRVSITCIGKQRSGWHRLGTTWQRPSGIKLSPGPCTFLVIRRSPDLPEHEQNLQL